MKNPIAPAKIGSPACAGWGSRTAYIAATAFRQMPYKSGLRLIMERMVLRRSAGSRPATVIPRASAWASSLWFLTFLLYHILPNRNSLYVNKSETGLVTL